MRLFTLPILAASLATAIATPLPTCPPHLRTQLCTTNPTTITPKTRVSPSPHRRLIQPRIPPSPQPTQLTHPRPSPLRPRTLPSKTLTWATPNTDTSIRTTLIRQIPGLVVYYTLNDISNYISEHLARFQDSNLPGGAFSWEGQESLMLQVVNADNHQTTWGVLGAAVSALRACMIASESGSAGQGSALRWGYAAYFSILDGDNVVGVGMIG
ncbi:MAG: hypothetical protein FRX48_08121 [Lasallia pustulata]|uniref:Uncharacterized protein n=1 Tax=Lasallia pustulata TaxID=136370 RepID=A0A5M8PG88_9LECA|nr:MAG: hypothetical protein FRX48_08121 [Lasallia pustulata]